MASAATMMIGSAVLGGVTTVASGAQRNAAIKQQRDEAIRKTQMDAREAEIQRLETMKKETAQNMLMASISGTTGNHDSILQGNINSAEEDITMIQKFSVAQQKSLNSSANLQIGANNLATTSSIFGSIATATSGVMGLTEKEKASKLKETKNPNDSIFGK